MPKRRLAVLLVLLITLLLSSGCAGFAKEGDILWQHTVGENIESTITIDENGNIYTTGGGNIWSFTSDGKLRWKTCSLDEGCKGLQQEYPYALGVASSPAVSPDGEKVYITGYAGAFAFRTSDGKLLWKKTVFDNYYEFSEKNFEDQVKIWKESASKDYPKIFATTPAVSADGTRLYAGAGDNDFSSDSFYCIDTKDGSVIWEYVMPHPPQQVEEGKYTRGYLGGASPGPDGTVYVASMHGWLVSLTDNGNSYTENWAYNVGAEMRMPPSMDAEGFLYVGSSSAGGYIHKVDSRTGKKAEGKWPVKTLASEVFANIAIASDGTIYANSEDYRLWAFNPDGTVKWNNLKFEHWGGDPLIRADDRIIVTSQLNKGARVVCIRDDGDKGVIEWFSEPITTELAYNETNVNIAPNGDIYVTSGVESPQALFAIKGNGLDLSKTSPWPKYMGNIQNNGHAVKKLGSSEEDKAYNEFYKRVLADEPYIGFFAAEKKCITRLDDAYKKARRELFLGIRDCKEGCEEFIKPFMAFCKEKDYLAEGSEEQWEKTLTILSFVLYANKPIFEFSADDIIEHRDLVFAEYPNKKLELDLFLPKQPLDEPVPCVVCIHGGVWTVNRRLWFEPFAKYLASEGMAAVTIDYRMLPAVKIIDCVYDTKAAVRWVRANAKKYGIDPDRIGALGASAGAHLVALLATTANVPELEGTGGNPGVSTAIQAGVGFATPAFKVSSIDPSWLEEFGLEHEDIKIISPYEHISSSAAPLYLVHGKQDRIVKPQDSQDLYDKYKEVGAHVELKWVPDKGHGFYEGTDLGITLATEFFKEQFGLEQDIEDGTIKWSCKIRGIVLKGGLALGPDNTIYAGTTEGWVYGVNPNGSVKWELDLNPDEITAEDKLPQLDEIPEGVDVSEIPDSIVIPDEALEHDDFSHSSGTLTADGKRLYVAGHTSGKIYCIDTAKGSVIWALNVREIPEVKKDRVHYGGGFVSSPAIGADGTIYIGSGDWWGDQWAEAKRMGIDFEDVVKRRFSDKRLYAINPDGTLKWMFTVEETDTHRTSIFGCPAIGADGTIYFGCFNGIFYAIKDMGDKAKELWRHEVKGEPLSTAPTKYQEFWGSAAIAKDGTIYVGNNDYHVYAFNPDGSINWKFKTGNEVYQSVTIGGAGTIYIASEDRNIYALNTDGTLKWSWRPETGGIPFTASVTEDETIVFGLSGVNRVLALDSNTGEVKWQCILDERRGTDGTCTDPVIGPDGTIYMFGAGSINAIKGSSPLSTKSPWPKVNRDNSNTGRFY